MVSVGAAVGFSAFGKQLVQDKVLQVHELRITKTYQDLNASSGEIQVLEFPPGADILKLSAVIGQEFDFSPSTDRLFDPGELKVGDKTCAASDINLKEENSMDEVGMGQAMEVNGICSLAQPTSLFVTGDTRFIQGKVEFIATYVVH